MNKAAKGKVIWKFGDNYNADLIVGSKHISERDPQILRQACLAELDPQFSLKVRPGDVMVAGKNFGYGHPHQQGIISLLQNKISTLIAESFYPLWYRMAFFYAFPVLICPGIFSQVEVDQELEVDFTTGTVANLTTRETLQGEPVPGFLFNVVKSGGLMPHLKSQMASKAKT